MIDSSPATFWCETLFIDGIPTDAVRIEVGIDRRITRIVPGSPVEAGDTRLGTVLPGMANAHSHAFHRALRGRTHSGGGDFWKWRESMYDVAGRLNPDLYYQLARAVFAEMLVSGWTAVGEFHYIHHQPDGTEYEASHAMERALAAAASDVGIRLVLLDTCYLTGGIDQPIGENQRAFSDLTATQWLARWMSLRATLGERPDGLVTLGAAVHSVRAVPPHDIGLIARAISADVPLHVHLSEQPRENTDCFDAYGLTPTGILDQAGALHSRLSVVHATHLARRDIALLGDAGVNVVMCPTTEADLGDGIGPAGELDSAGATISLGSDQNAVIDPFLEMRGLEMGERLKLGERGRFSPPQLIQSASSNGYRALGLGDNHLVAGAHCDLVEISSTSIRTVGSSPAELPLTATSADIVRVIVRGKIVAEYGHLLSSSTTTFDPRPEVLLAEALSGLELNSVRR